MNRVDNALDALCWIPLGGQRGWIEVGVRQEDDEVRVVVRDSGPGVAPEIAEDDDGAVFTARLTL